MLTLVIVNYKMDKIEELRIRLDGILERRSRDLCLRELFNFAKERFDYYHDSSMEKRC